ncbi:MAG: ATP-binding cassette domain-containing protein, partial [Planctomycetes bacterium]|nr:ATP-binding cassette domain-containing protein [Planctomycetota bacterium]
PRPGGARQRVAVARAFLRGPRVLLLDEPTSALDARAEGLVQEGLEALAAGRTTLLVTHRAAAAGRCDVVVFLEGGRVAGVGRHEELMRGVEGYRGVWGG